MRRRRFLCAVWLTWGAAAVAEDRTSTAPAGDGAPAAGPALYRLERGNLNYADIITLKNGVKYAGKAMEWADQVLLFDPAGHVTAFRGEEVTAVQFRRIHRHNARPQLPDLTVAWVERLPRDPHWHGHVIVEGGIPRLDRDVEQVAAHPPPGSSVTFRVHVLNAGTVESKPVPMTLKIDGRELHSAELPPLGPGASHVVSADWAWKEGTHMLRVEIDPAARAPDLLRWNNVHEEPTTALAVTAVVARDRYEAFARTPNAVDSCCFEDWVQFQLESLNSLFARSIYPTAPEGVRERLRLDRVVVVNDPLNDRSRQQWLAGLHQGGKPDQPAEYAGLLVYGRLGSSEEPTYSALKTDWPALQRLCGELGLIYLDKTDTTVSQCMVLDRFDRHVLVEHFFPNTRTLMYTPGGFPLTELCANYLNRVVGRPRGVRGEYLYELPDRVSLEIRSNSGRPLREVRVDAFQLQSEGDFAGTIAGFGRGDPLYSATTDAAGRVELLNQEVPAQRTPNGYVLRPNPFGRIACDGSNGLLLLRLRFGDHEEFHFLRLFDCALARVRGHTEEYPIVVSTRFADPGAPKPPLFAGPYMGDRSTPRPDLKVAWRLSRDSRKLKLEEFRVYKRTGFGGDDARPWTLYTVSRRGKGWQPVIDATYFDDLLGDARYTLDTFYTVTAVDSQGRESEPCPTAFILHGREVVKFAIAADAAYMTLQGDGPVDMLRWDSRAGTQPFGVRTGVIKGYEPSFAGIAVTSDQRLVVTDPLNHVLAFYDQNGTLNEVYPAREWWPGFASDEPGEFNYPLDVAVDSGGQIYVADTGNNRIQVLDAVGQFRHLLDPSFEFRAPTALGFSNGHLCVTDDYGRRCRIYDVREGRRTFVREIHGLVDADRALVSRSGKVYVTGRAAEGAPVRLLIFNPSGTTATFDQALEKIDFGNLYSPRSLYLYFASSVDKDYLFCVNAFPFDVRRLKME